eukprot:177963-Hanusia_phi.AAC.1
MVFVTGTWLCSFPAGALRDNFDVTPAARAAPPAGPLAVEAELLGGAWGLAGGDFFTCCRLLLDLLLAAGFDLLLAA